LLEDLQSNGTDNSLNISFNLTSGRYWHWTSIFKWLFL